MPTTHGSDYQGRQFDKDGNMNNWWTDEDAAAFKAKTEKLVEQFDAVEVLPAEGERAALYADGKLSLGENIADHEPERVDGLSADKRFYLAYATLWGQNIRDEEIARLTKIDVHSLGKNRVNVTLRNIDSFLEAFDIEQGAMFRPEAERIIIW